MKHVLILSDGRMGHLNQSIAFAKTMGYSYDILDVKFKNKFCKVLSYVFDKLNIYSKHLLDVGVVNTYTMVIGTGSNTYYATKVMAEDMGVKSVVMMLPKGYRLNFDLIFAQSHDNPPKQENIIEIPANFSYVEPAGIYKKTKKKSIGVVIGGDNKIFKMSEASLSKQLDFIKTYYKGYALAITTSPRTSSSVEMLVASYDFDYKVIFSKNPINPIADFLQQCETVFITADSTSMISEAISYGNSNVIILPLESPNTDSEHKFTTFIKTLEKEEYLHIFDGKIQHKNRKIDFTQYTKQVNI